MSVTAIPRKESCSVGEWNARVDLAALYRLFVHYGWTDLTYTHITARVPDQATHYLINPYGLMFDEISASNLLKVDFDGNLITGDYPYNQAGHLIHTAVLKARPEINFVLHSHTRASTAVSAMKPGLLPLSQHAMTVMAEVAYHPYQDVTNADDECDKLATDLGQKHLMMLENHGLLACGRTAAEAFRLHYFLEMACKIQVDVLASGAETIEPPAPVVQGVNAWGKVGPEPGGAVEWQALMRLLDRMDPSFRE